MSTSCLFIKAFRAFLLVCPQFLVAFVGIGKNGRIEWDDVVVGCGMWVGRELAKNEGSTFAITNAGAKRSYFYKKDKKVNFTEMDFFVHLENVSMIFTDSCIEGVHLGDMDFFVHLSKMDFVIETHPAFAT